MNGRELAARLLALRPALKVIYTSGYASPAILPRGGLEENVVFLQKPFTLAELAAKLGDLLDPPRAA
jgi:CheY-like chemotaxis protein